MKKMISLALVIGATLVIAPGYAHDKMTPPPAAQVAVNTAQYSIENMTCKMCDITVRKSMENVAGVTKATVDYATKTATVIFNPAKTTIEAIGMASTNAGYKATAIQASTD